MENEPKSDHRLAAIMATDVVGYSSLMQSDEAKALSALATIRQVTTDQIKQRRKPLRKIDMALPALNRPSGTLSRDCFRLGSNTNHQND